MWFWLLIGTFVVVTILYVSIRIFQYLSEREDLEDDAPADDDRT